MKLLYRDVLCIAVHPKRFLGVIGSIPPPQHGELSWCQRARFWSHLITTLSPSSPLNHWQTSDGPLHVLSWAGGTLRALQDFSPSRHSVLPIVFLVNIVSAALRSLTRSSRAVLGWFLIVLMIIETPQGEILHGAPVRGRLTIILCFFHLGIIAPTVVTFSPSCLAMVL